MTLRPLSTLPTHSTCKAKIRSQEHECSTIPAQKQTVTKAKENCLLLKKVKSLTSHFVLNRTKETFLTKNSFRMFMNESPGSVESSRFYHTQF